MVIYKTVGVMLI